jgi:hypothetical protein
VPAAVVTWSVGGGTAGRELLLEAVYPGAEAQTRMRFADAATHD